MQILKSPSRPLVLRKRQAFSLIELIVVTAIGAILLSLSLVAVHSARESSRRLSCANNMKQISLGCQNFESVFRSFPASLSTRRTPVLSSWLYRLLPYTESASLFDSATNEFQMQPDPFVHHHMQQVIKMYQCPADPSSGQLRWTTDSRVPLVATTSYLGVSGINSIGNSGALFINSWLRLSEFSDGVSTTLLLGERPPSNDSNFGWWYSGIGFDGNGTADLSLGVQERLVSNVVYRHLDDCLPGDSKFLVGRKSQCDCTHFWSYHPGGANFARCDGSVGFYAYGCDDVLASLSTRANNDVVSQ